MKHLTVSFHECEHQGDLDNYLEDLRNSGATINDQKLNYDCETADVDISVSLLVDFFVEFKKTDACGFSSYSHLQD